MKAGQWFSLKNATNDPSIVDIHIIDFIGDWIDDYYGFGVTAKSFIEQLSKLDAGVKTIRVHINSPGGDVFSALNIANALRDQATSKGRTVETIVDGLAASAASIVMMAGSVVRIADNGMVMVHNPWTVGIGNAANMRKLADELDAVRNTIVATYKWHSAKSEEELIALLDAETWMDADAAIEHGFASEKIEGLKAAASLDQRAISALKVPERFRAQLEALAKRPEPAAVPAPPVDVLAAVEAAGLSTTFARELVAAALPMDQVTARVADAAAHKTAAEARAREITALCTTAKLPELAAGYIKGAVTVEDVRVHLTTITAKKDTTEIDGGLPAGGHHVRPTPVIDTAAIYRERNAH